MAADDGDRTGEGTGGSGWVDQAVAHVDEAKDAADQAAASAQAGASGVLGGNALDLQESERLPWLESADDDDQYGAVDNRRVFGFVAGGLALLAAIVGGIWWGTHRNDAAPQVADGGVIKAPPGPYKSAPADPGGKTFEGTGDSSFAVSQGHNPVVHLGNGGANGGANSVDGGAAVASASNAAAAASAAAAAGTATAGKGATALAHTDARADRAPAETAKPQPFTTATGGVGVQIGAYSSQAAAEAGWTRLSKQSPALAGLGHRIVQGKAEIGTVFRLQAVAGSDAAAGALCATLRGQDIACQVRH
jgi:hypothetical protein